jgi:hypothetical protein
VSDLWIEADFGNRKPGLMIEVPVSPEAGPYLVSGTRRWVWIDSARGGFVRSALRDGDAPDLELSLVREVARSGQERRWGNGFPATDAGLKSAKEYLAFYGIVEVDLLRSEGVTLPGELRPWIPTGCAVMVAKDRSYLGMRGNFGSRWSVVMHNPSRGMAVLGDW